MARIPRPPRPNLDLSAIGRALARARDALGDLGFAVGRGARAVGSGLAAGAERARTLWFRLSVETRQRIAVAAGVVVVAAAIWFAAVPNLPCQFPAGDECPPPDEAAELVPGDALAYAHANVDPETQQYEEAAALGARLPDLSRQLVALLGQSAGLPLDFERRVAPWLGGEVAVAVVPGEGGRPERALLLEAEDPAAAEQFAERSARGELSEERHAGVTVRTDAAGTSSALAGGFLVLGETLAVERAIDVDRGERRSLAASPLGQDVLAELPDDSIAQVAVSEDGVTELLAGGQGGFGSLEAFVNFEATAGAGAALGADEEAFELTVRSQLDPERLERSPGFFDAFAPFEPTLAEELHPDTLAYTGLGDPAKSIEDLFTQAVAEAPGIATGFDQLVDDLRRTGKLDLQSEVLPLLEGEAAIAVEPAGLPYLLFLADEVDEGRATETLAKLQGPLAKALDPGEALQAPVSSEREIDGVKAHSLRLSRTVDLTYAAFDGKLVVATDPQGVAEVRSGEGGLDGSSGYRLATEGLSDEPSLLVYLNLADLVSLGERAGLAEDSAYAEFASDIRRLAGLGLAVESDEESLETTVRLTVPD